MERAFEIDVIRQIVEQLMLQEHIKNPYFIGGKNQLALTSFYEHLASDEEVDRYVKTVRDLTEQQNRMGLLANGVIVAPSSPTITNLNQCTIIPLDFTINFRCTLENRDLLKYSLNNVVRILKGRKQDICEFDNGKLFLVGTLGNNVNGNPQIRNGDFIGISSEDDIDTYIKGVISDLVDYKGFEVYNNVEGNYLYFEDIDTHQLKVAILEYDTDNEIFVWNPQVQSNNYPNVIFPPEHNSFTKWKVSISFDSTRCSEPRTLNSKELCDLSLGGSATIVSRSVLLGNELTKLYIKKYGIKNASGFTQNSDTTKYWLEPLEMPSGNGASTTPNQLISNAFVTNSHTDGMTISRQYSFVYDYSIGLLKELYEYSRYGIQTHITPNLIYEVCEVFSSWGVVDLYTRYFKVVEDIEVENNESDVVTISMPLQLQGDND